MTDKRVCFDFEVDFGHGGCLQGRGFRLDIDGDDIRDEQLAARVIAELGLQTVAAVRIRNRSTIEERDPGGSARRVAAAARGCLRIDLSHDIEHGMVTYKGLPAPLICDHLSRAASRAHYAAGTEFHIGRIDMVANTGTYIDAPFHRYADGVDVAGIELAAIAGVPGVLVRVEGATTRAIDEDAFGVTDVKGKAVLVHTGWSRHWRTDAYFEGHPFLTKRAATHLRDRGAVLVGIDSLNIDDTSDGTRPVHSVLLGSGIPIVEHLTHLDALPLHGFRFWAVPPKVRGMGTFPVRAHAELLDPDEATPG